MRGFSKVSPSLWHSEKFATVRAIVSRHLYLYLLTSPHSNSAGCYDLRDGYVTADLRIDSDAYHRALAELEIARLIAVDNSVDNPVDNPAGSTRTILIENWCTFNVPSNARHAIAILDELGAVSSRRLKRQRFQEFSELVEERKLTNDGQAGPKLKGLMRKLRTASELAPSTETETQTQTETRETETETETETKTRARENALTPGATATAPGNGSVAPEEEKNPTIPDRFNTPLLRRTAAAGGKDRE